MALTWFQDMVPGHGFDPYLQKQSISKPPRSRPSTMPPPLSFLCIAANNHSPYVEAAAMLAAVVFTILMALHTMGMPLPRIVIREAAASTVDEFSKSLHSSAALGAMTLLYTMHKALKSTGFILTQRLLSTDFAISVATCIIAFVWAFLVFASSYWVDDAPCQIGEWHQCLGRLAFVPWILLAMSGAWCVWMLDSVLHQEAKKSHDERIGLW